MPGGQQPYDTGDKFLDGVLEESRMRRQTGTATPRANDEGMIQPTLRQRYEGQRESTNVEDRRDENYTIDPNAPMAMPGFRLVGGPLPMTPQRAKQAYEAAIQMGRGFMEDVNRTLQELVNPSAGVTAEPGTEERYAQELLAQRAQGRAAAGVAVDLLGTGGIAALRRPGASVGSFGGSLPTRARISDDIEARKVWEGGAGTEFRLSTKDGKKAGEFTINDGPIPKSAQIENIDVRVQGKGTGTKVYDAAEEMATANGKTLVPSATLQEGTYRIWKKRNPKLLEAGEYKKTPDGSYERGDDTFKSYFQKMSATVGATAATSTTSKADNNRPWSSLEDLRSNMKGPDREWVGNPVQLENGGHLSYPMAPTWKGVEQETGMTKKQLKNYFQQQIDQKVTSERERKYLKRDLDELFERKDTGSGIGEGWYDLQELIRPRPEGSPATNEPPPPSTGDGGIGEGKAFYGM